MIRTRSTSLLLFASLLAFTGCKPDAAIKTSSALDSKTQSSAPAPAPAPPPANAGSIGGVVHFSGKPPARVPIDMSMDPACSLAAQNLSEQYVVTAGRLANVYLYVKAGAPATSAPAGTAPVILDQKGCRYTPHVIAVQQGGTVEFHNSDPTMHNIHATPANGANSSVDVSQAPMGQPQSQKFNSPETMLPVRCNNHPWMNAFINVAPNAFFAVSAADGSFVIHGLPPGHYTLAALHEKLGEQDVEVDVLANGTAKTDFTFAAK